MQTCDIPDVGVSSKLLSLLGGVVPLTVVPILFKATIIQIDIKIEIAMKVNVKGR